MNYGAESGSGERGSLPSWSAQIDLGGAALKMTDKVRLALDEEAGGLLSLQSNLVRNYFRLQEAERGLTGRAESLRRGGASSAIRQVELERVRLGRELHTGVGQTLAAIRLQLEVVASQLPNPPELVAKALERISTLASEALELVRSISHRLHPPEWQRLTLEAAIRRLWETSGMPERMEATLRIEPLEREPEQEIKVLFYRTAQEALFNVTRHARATKIDLSLETRGGRVVITIADNGVGFDVARLQTAQGGVAEGLGLRSIREQAEALGGRLEITSGSEGTKLELNAPFMAAEA